MVENLTEDKRSGRIVAVVLICCVVIVAFWEIMSNRERIRKPFQLTSEDFSEFVPVIEGWQVKPIPVASDETEPNIAAYQFTRKSGLGEPSARNPQSRVRDSLVVRLVHGYNMCDCMRIKQYKVELVDEIRDMRYGMRDSKDSNKVNGSLAPMDAPVLPLVQVWRLTSSVGDVSIWVTSMLRLGDFSGTEVDVRSMPFPRIGVPDDPGWVPRGFTLKSLRHPVRNFRWFLRAKWNNARCDLMTFLKLKQPAWASDDDLTLVTAHVGRTINLEEERGTMENVVLMHTAAYKELRNAWKTQMNRVESM